jgi:hypothetical protein
MRGQIGEVLLFDRLLSEEERATIEEYLLAKWVIGELSDGTELDGVAFDVAAGATLDLGNSDRTGVTVMGEGTIANGKLADGSVISPAGDDAIGELTFSNVTFGEVEYRVTVSGNTSDCLLVDGDLSSLTVVPSNDAEITGTSYVIATGNITGNYPTLDGFPSKYKLRKSGNDLLLTSLGGTVLILR